MSSIKKLIWLKGLNLFTFNETKKSLDKKSEDHKKNISKNEIMITLKKI